MQISKAHVTTGYIERPKDGRIGHQQLQYSAVDRDHHAAVLARKNREVIEFIAKLRNKSAAK